MAAALKTGEGSTPAAVIAVPRSPRSAQCVTAGSSEGRVSELIALKSRVVVVAGPAQRTRCQACRLRLEVGAVADQFAVAWFWAVAARWNSCGAIRPAIGERSSFRMRLR